MALSNSTLKAHIVEVLRAGAVRTVFQPIVDLHSGSMVAVEALSRGPAGTDLEAPDALFAAAAESGWTLQLDQLCIKRAMRAARSVNEGLAVFINAEPQTLAHPSTARLLGGLGEQLMIEVTERHLARDPAGVLRCLAYVRAVGAGVALDDLGADPTSTAFLSFVQPDVIKLDMALIQGRPTELIGQVATAVMAHAERTGAVILAEGIETEQQRRRALGLGATLGQGYLFGRPGERIDDVDLPIASWAGVRTPSTPVPDEDTPFRALNARNVTTHVADIGLLLQISKHIEAQASRQSDLVLLAAFQESDRFTAHTAQRYERLAQHLPFVAVLGVGLATTPAKGVRGAALREDDPLRGEWAVIALSPHYAGALIARDLGDDGPRLQRRFQYAVTHDRPLVTAAALTTMNRVTAISE
jgi:EAL domain-containing protein (putative c-di-GMP-specific phosphodiesterase class I)